MIVIGLLIFFNRFTIIARLLSDACYLKVQEFKSSTFKVEFSTFHFPTSQLHFEL